MQYFYLITIESHPLGRAQLLITDSGTIFAQGDPADRYATVYNHICDMYGLSKGATAVVFYHTEPVSPRP